MAEEGGVAEAEASVVNAPNQLERKIIRQIEVSRPAQSVCQLSCTLDADFALFGCVQFYFGDRNLPRDKFLQEKIKEDEGCELYELSCLRSRDRNRG